MTSRMVIGYLLCLEGPPRNRDRSGQNRRASSSSTARNTFRSARWWLPHATCGVLPVCIVLPGSSREHRTRCAYVRFLENSWNYELCEIHRTREKRGPNRGRSADGQPLAWGSHKGNVNWRLSNCRVIFVCRRGFLDRLVLSVAAWRAIGHPEFVRTQLIRRETRFRRAARAVKICTVLRQEFAGPWRASIISRMIRLELPRRRKPRSSRT